MPADHWPRPEAFPEGLTPPSVPQPHDLRTFLELVREDFDANGRDWRLPGFRALFVYRLGNFRLGLPNTPIRKLLSVAYRAMHRFVRNRYGIELHGTAWVGRRVRLIHQHGMIIHGFAIIGDECWIRHGVTLGGGVDWARDDHPTLGRDVRIGAGAVLMGRFSVADGTRIGPNAVVSRNTKPGDMILAPPPRAIHRQRSRLN